MFAMAHRMPLPKPYSTSTILWHVNPLLKKNRRPTAG